MSLINRIPRLAKIPKLLNKKRDAEKESKDKKKEDETPPFPLEDKSAFKKPRMEKIKKTKAVPDNKKSQSNKEGVGQNIDLTI